MNNAKLNDIVQATPIDEIPEDPITPPLVHQTNAVNISPYR